MRRDAWGAEAGLVVRLPLKALPWMMRVERVVFAHWEMVADGTVRCTHCGSTHGARKSNQPRLKKYHDSAGNLQTVEVYRYSCHNKLCNKGSFTPFSQACSEPVEGTLSPGFAASAPGVGRLRRQSGTYRFSVCRPQCRLVSGGGSESCPQLMTVAPSAFLPRRRFCYNSADLISLEYDQDSRKEQ